MAKDYYESSLELHAMKLDEDLADSARYLNKMNLQYFPKEVAMSVQKTAEYEEVLGIEGARPSATGVFGQPILRSERRDTKK